MNHGFYIAFNEEPDGRYSWVVVSELAAEIGDRAGGGLADDWDDAKLAAVADLYLPSDEANATGA